MNKFSFEYRQGCYRKVFLLYSFAIKIPQFYSWEILLKGLLANIQEKQLSDFQNRNPKECHKFCPIIFSIRGGFLNIMRCATSITDKEFEELDDGFFEGVGTMVERKSNSLGWLDNKVVFIDYGG